MVDAGHDTATRGASIGIQSNKFDPFTDKGSFQREFVVAGTPVERMGLPNLEEGESAVYQQLVDNNWRFEQERIRQEDVLLAIGRIRI